MKTSLTAFSIAVLCSMLSAQEGSHAPKPEEQSGSARQPQVLETAKFRQLRER